MVWSRSLAPLYRAWLARIGLGGFLLGLSLVLVQCTSGATVLVVKGAWYIF